MIDNGCEQSEITLNMAEGDQLNILLHVMSKIKNWVEHSSVTSCHDGSAKKFTPLRLTVRGCAGAGKSFFIKCLVNTVMKMFSNARVIEVAGPTGASAYNVGGETLHRKWRINPHKPGASLGEKSKDALITNHKRTLVVVIDERSLLTCDVLGAAERNTASTVHGGTHDDEDWGGVPIVILVGDDYQLPPPTNREKGAFDLMDVKTSLSQQQFGVASSGAATMIALAKQCMELTTTKRQNSDQTEFKEVLTHIRTGDTTPGDADFLLKRHMSNFSNDEINTIKKSGVIMHLFATKAPRDEHNYRCLSNISSSTNPVALLKAQWTTRKAKCQDHFTDPPPNATLISRGAMVKISGRNFEPAWGLYNNAVGVVDEIMFSSGKDPNNGDLPEYVAVHFEHYCGPVWDKNNPKTVPIPMVTTRCDKKCCSVKFCPLALSFGMTLHTFQGQSAGPVAPGQPKNAVDKVIVEPGNRAFEGNNPGTLYMAASRATTAGSGELLDSALFFTGTNMGTHRVLNLKHQKIPGRAGEKRLYRKVALREKWVKHLDRNTDNQPLQEDEASTIKAWCKEFRMNLKDLDEALARRTWRHNMKSGVANY